MRIKNKELENISSSGGLLSEHFIALMREDTVSHPLVAPKTFRLPWSKSDAALDKREYELRVSRAWKELQERWDLYGYKLQSMDPADARSRWTMPLLESLGYEPVSTPKHIEISDAMKFRFSHRGWIESPENGKPPVVHVVPPAQDLDERSAEDRGQPCPHDALQAYLNVHGDKWGLVTNGLYLRLLRDYHHTYTKGYIEFDLEAIFLTRSFRDFQALYRLAHVSRFMPSETGEIYLEEYFKHNQAVGEKVGAGLRKRVISAINTLGNGFLDAELISELKGDQDKCLRFYEELLKTVYRIIFLLYAEQRGMVGGSSGNNLYLEEYSLSALRERATRHGKEDGHKDLWIGLQNTFRMIWKGVPTLGIYPYNGMLFETSGEEYTSRFGCKNSDLLDAIRFLTLTEIDGTARRINYSEINVEEIGSIYESLLDFTPRIIDQPEEIEGISYSANSFILDPRGSARKTTGSYYTHPDLVQELIKSALEPVMQERLKEAGTDKAAREKAILSIKVCDPACGSGAFLIAACNRLGLELARVRKEPGVPDEDDIQKAKRDVLQSCIYGVDLNNWAVELARVSLWINAMVKDKPLNFLDHHIKCGNSLIGATPELIAGGVPEGAFEPITGDNKKIVSEAKRINKRQRANKTWDTVERDVIKALTEKFSRLSVISEDSSTGVVDKCKAYHMLQQDTEFQRLKLEADAWTAAFFVPLDGSLTELPTTAEVRRLGAEGGDDFLASAVREMAEKYRFFHWHLEFPDVFAKGGFDVILANPPWERIKLQEKEFFAAKDAEIANAPKAAARKKLIARLKETRPELAKEYSAALRKSEAESKFIRSSRRFPLTGVGDVNSYAVFAELAKTLITVGGRSGIVVPSGIATDYTYKEFFSSLMENGALVSLFDFENREGLFEGTHRSYKFSLMTIAKGGVPHAEFAFFLHNVRELFDPERRFTLSKEDLALLNPNTSTCPIFRKRSDAELTKKLYQATPVLINEVTGENPWGVRFLRMFDMANDSGLFRTAEQLETEGFRRVGNRFVRGEKVYLPLYEAKMIWHYDHRYGTYEGVQDRSNTHLPTPGEGEHADAAFLAQPWYWVAEEEVQHKLGEWKRGWLMGWRDVTNSTNERTAIFSLLPLAGVGHKLPLAFFVGASSIHILCFIENVSSMLFDFIVRQKVGGTSLGIFILRQLPILSPTAYPAEDLRFILPRVLELVYTAWDIKPFADDVWRDADEDLRAAIRLQWDENAQDTSGHTWNLPDWKEAYPEIETHPEKGIPLPPFKWDPGRRAQLRAELDAIYAHLYGLTKEELDYILETFPIVKMKDIEKYGSYRTKEMILQCYEKYAAMFNEPPEEASR